MTTNAVYKEPEAIASRLEQLCLNEEDLRDSIYQAHLQRVRLTPNHPRIFPGLEMWGWAVSSLREHLRPHGWVRVEAGNFSLTVHEELGIAIAIASGDESTGNAYAHPSNRSKKGRNTVEAVEANQQFDLFEDLLPETKEEAGGRDTWVLLHHTDAVKKEIRIELSRPSEIGNDGKICAWSERILLGSISFDDDIIDISPGSGPDIDIEIRRKA